MPSKEKEEYASIDRVVQIPLVNGCLDAFINAVNANTYTRSGFSTAKGFSASVFQLTEPHISPLLVYADGYAVKTLDVAQEKFPVVFTTKPEDVVSFVQGHRKNASDYVNGQRDTVSRVLGERVTSPAYAVVEVVDQVSFPIAATSTTSLTSVSFSVARES
jgi:hypothetical protein